MEKTIYDLTIGDSYYVPLLSKYTETMENPMFWKPTKNKIRNEESLILFNGLVSGGKAFLTEQDCQKSIDYDVALAKITKRASELEERYTEIEDKFFYIIWVDENEKLHWSHHGKTNSFKVAFKSMETAIIIIEELPEECKIVLGVE